jgi:hypothetical protein
MAFFREPRPVCWQGTSAEFTVRFGVVASVCPVPIRGEVAVSGPGGQGYGAPVPDSRLKGGSRGRDDIDGTDDCG